MISLDEATPSDIPQLCRLLGHLFAQEREFSPDSAKQATAFTLLVGNPQRGRVFVLREGAVIRGMVTVQALVSTACGGDVLVLEDLVVDPEHRGRGYGSALLDCAVDFAKANGFRRITLLTDSINEKARRLYSRHGFFASDMVPYRLFP